MLRSFDLVGFKNLQGLDEICLKNHTYKVFKTLQETNCVILVSILTKASATTFVDLSSWSGGIAWPKIYVLGLGG